MALELRLALRRTPVTAAILEGHVSSEKVQLRHTPIEPISGAFRRAIRNEEFDVSEMALVTLAMARDMGEPWIGLPVVLLDGFNHGALRVKPESPIRGPRDLPGKRVGVRAYSQTTGVWMRGILKSSYGVRYEECTWVTTEDAHVPKFRDPEFVERAPSGTKLQQLFADGAVDAVIGDSSSRFGETRSVIPYAEKEAEAWFELTGVVPVNHVLAVRTDLLKQHPWVAAELASLFVQCGAATVSDRAVNLCMEFALDQRLLRRSVRFSDVFVLTT